MHFGTFHIFWYSLTWTYSKSKMHKTLFFILLTTCVLWLFVSQLHKSLDCWSRYMLRFEFLEKSLGLVLPPHSVHDFSKILFSFYILETDPISLSDCLYFLRYCVTCILHALIIFPVYDIIDFEINLIFLNKPFSYITKKLKTKI